jgi:glycosyltransferase involved in cell wall biosynthesis
VTAVAPASVHGDLRPIRYTPDPTDACRTEAIDAYLTRKMQVMVYGRALRSILRDRWDLVHCWEEPFALAAAQVCYWTPAGVPVVPYTHQNLSKRYPPPFHWVERYTIRRSAGWVCGGTTVERTMLGRPGYPDRPHAVIPLGVDTTAFRPDPAARAAVRRRLGWDDAVPVVGYLGRFIPEKGVPLLVRALERLPGRWRALFVGGGPLEADLRAFADRHPGAVRVVTGVPHEQVPEHLNAMDILAAPSQTTPKWKEQLGRMLIEAFACRVAVVASDSGEIPHVVGDAGRVVPEADEAAWAAALDELIADASVRSALAAAGRQRAAERFDWTVVGARHVEFFDRLVESRSTTAGTFV